MHLDRQHIFPALEQRLNIIQRKSIRQSALVDLRLPVIIRPLLVMGNSARRPDIGAGDLAAVEISHEGIVIIDM